MTTSADVIAAARRYLRVRWHHQGRSPAGLDCIGLVVRVAHDLGLSRADATDYSRLPEGERLRTELAAHLSEEPAGTVPRPGHVALFRFDADPQHLAIVGDYPAAGEVSMIHAYAPARRVVEHRMDDLWRSRIVVLYRIPGVED